MNRKPKLPPPPRYLIVVEAKPGDIPPISRLKRWLKAGGRYYGLRATFAVERGLPRMDIDDPEALAQELPQDNTTEGHQ